MLKRRWVTGLCLIILVLVCKECLSKEEFTISSKELIERLTRLEEGQKALDKRIDDLRSELKGDISELGGRIDDVNKRIDSLQNIMLTGFGILFAGMFTLIGFVIWDRRTALSPVVRRVRELEEEKELTLRALREYAKREPKMEEVLKSLRLL